MAGQAEQTRDRLADALETAKGAGAATSGVRSILVVISVRPSVCPYVSTRESVNGFYSNLTRIQATGDNQKFVYVTFLQLLVTNTVGTQTCEVGLY
jgi:hypothetical protein